MREMATSSEYRHVFDGTLGYFRSASVRLSGRFRDPDSR